MKKIFILLGVLALQSRIMAQFADVTYSVQTIDIYSHENASGGSCWEVGEEEYTAYISSWDNVDGNGYSTGCQTCANNGDCVFVSGINLQTRSNNAYTLYAAINAWEDDSGDRCTNDGSDDCHRQESQGINFRESVTPSNGVYTDGPRWGSSADHEWSVRYTWKYSGSANLLTPGCAQQSAAVVAGAIRSFTAYLSAGRVYQFGTCDAGEDTYIRIYSGDGYSLAASNDDNGALCSGTKASLEFTAPGTGYYYIEIARYSRNALTSNFNFTYRIKPPVGAFLSNAIFATTFSTCGFYSDTKNNSPSNCYGNDYGSTSDDIYYSFTTAYNGYFEMAHCGSGFDTRIYLLDSGGNLIASNDDNGPICSGTAASLLQLINAGTYYVVSEGFSSNAGNIATQIRPHIPAGGSISGISTVCQNQTGAAYSISGVSAATNYAWTVPAGATITNGQGTTSITVNFGLNGGFVSCIPKNFGDQCTGATLNFFVNMNTLSAEPSAISGASQMCPGTSTTLNVDGGSLGTGASWQWFTESCNGTFIASGNSSLLISPTVTTTYFARASGTCNITNCVSHTVNVTPDPVVSITGETPVCEGGAVQLTANVSGGSGAPSYQWRINGSPVGGNSPTYITDANLSAGIYTYSVEVTQTLLGCNGTSPGFQLLIEGDPAINVLGTATICPGSTTSLSASGFGGVNCSTITWESSPDGISGWTSTGLTGENINVSPASTTYYRAVYGCSGTGCNPNPAYSEILTVTINTCNDNNPCTNDICNGSSCLHTTILGCCVTSASCNDGNACTTNECVNNLCQFTPVICNDNNSCTTDNCAGGNCIYNTIICNDNNPCTTDTCVNGCQYTPVNCDDSDPCTTDGCDSTGNCTHTSGGCTFTISGIIKTEAGHPVPGVTVSLTGSQTQSVVTTADGLYSFTVNAGDSVTITPLKNNDTITNKGVTTSDITIIRKHALGTWLDSPYKVIAGDASNNSSVTTADIPYVRAVVLNNTKKFPPNNSRLWEFVSSAQVFSGPPYNPFPFTKTRTYSNISSDHTAEDFIGVKIGDVNNSWTPPTP